MWDGHKKRGIVHSMDKSTDVALIKLTDDNNLSNLPVAKVGQSSSLRAGEFVVSISLNVLSVWRVSLYIIRLH